MAVGLAFGALERSPLGRGWVELYHSAPHWPDTIIIYRASPKAAPQIRRLLPDPSRTGFRVVRLRVAPLSPDAHHGLAGGDAADHAAGDAASLSPSLSLSAAAADAPPQMRFRLRPSGQRRAQGDSHVYTMPPVAGRYVVTTGVPQPVRVGPADVAACLQLYRPNDSVIELVFRPPAWWRRPMDDGTADAATEVSWLVAFAHHANPPFGAEWPRRPMQRRRVLVARDDEDDDKAIGGEANAKAVDGPAGDDDTGSHDMRKANQPLPAPDARADDEMKEDANVLQHEWFCRFESRGLDCVFTDGSGAWDNNDGGHYEVPMSGRYLIADQCIRYLGPSELDRHTNPL